MRGAGGLPCRPESAPVWRRTPNHLASDDDLAFDIDTVDLEHLLRKIESNAGNCCPGRPSMVIPLQRSLYGTSMPCEAPLTSSGSVTAAGSQRPPGTSG